jgi:cerevisin
VNGMIYTYHYNQPIGDGVDIYIVDSGVYTQNEEFEGRATLPWAASDYELVDGTGHGTHVAGIAAGKTYGVAKNANIIGVKVIDDNGNGDIANAVTGLNWVANNIKSTGKPSIVNMSFSSPASQLFDDAAIAMVSSGTAVVAAAGNGATDASSRSPARATQVITVGASDITNAMGSFSNFGKAVDIFGPGVGITSASIGGPSNTQMRSETSQAAAHVTGIAACLLSADTSMTPLDIITKIWDLATINVISGVPDGTINVFVYNGF